MTSSTSSSPAGASDDRGCDELWALDQIIGDLLVWTTGLISERQRDELRAARDHLGADRFRAVILGDSERGKSALINTLAGQEVLPTGAGELTTVVTTLVAGHAERLLVQFGDGHEEEHPVEQLGRFASLSQNPGNALGVACARVALDHARLGSGLEIIDVPAIGPISKPHVAATDGTLSGADAAVFVLDSDRPLAPDQCELLLEAVARGPQILIAITVSAQRPGLAPEHSVESITAALAELLEPGLAETFIVSVGRGDGLRELTDRVLELAMYQRAASRVVCVARQVARIAAQAICAAQFEIQAMRLAPDELQRRGSLLEMRLAEQRSLRDKATELLDREVQRSVHHLDVEGVTGMGAALEHLVELWQYLGRSAARRDAATASARAPSSTAHDARAPPGFAEQARRMIAIRT